MSAAPAAPPKPATRAQYDRLIAQFDEMARIAEDEARLARSAPSVSGWTVGQHVDHMATTDKMIGMGLMKCVFQPQKVEGGPKTIAKFILWSGWMPRGKGKAPEMTQPRAQSSEQIRTGIKTARGAIASMEGKLADLEKSESGIPHPMLGVFRPMHWMRFLEVHHNHHFKIIRDIERAAR